MRSLIIIIVFYIAAFTIPVECEDGIVADECTVDVCKTSDGCRCASYASPLEPDVPVPQLISLTFDEPVTDNWFTTVHEPILFNRVNPDGRPIGATFFVPHEYTDYTRVNALYNHGFEIGVNSITRNVFASYWPYADVEILKKEFGGQKKILSKFGNISADDILGARTPFLQLAGNSSIKAYQAVGLTYDSSWYTLLDQPLYPYTLDYLSVQQCYRFMKCPNEAFKGFWVLPINMLHSPDGSECSYLSSCNTTGTSDEIADWFIGEVERVRNSTKVPISLLITYAYFEFYENAFDGFIKFLDKLASYEDVFLVTQKQVMDWTKNPVRLSDFKTDFPQRNATCTPYTCELKKPDDAIRYLTSCVPCPATYPWLDNPDGN